MSLLNELDETKEYSMELMKKVRTFLWSPEADGSGFDQMALSERERSNLEVRLLSFVRGQVSIAWAIGRDRARRLETQARDHAEHTRQQERDGTLRLVLDALEDANNRIRRILAPPAQYTPPVGPHVYQPGLAETPFPAKWPTPIPYSYRTGDIQRMREENAPTRADVLGPQLKREEKSWTPLPTLDVNKDYEPHPDRAYLKPLEKAPVSYLTASEMFDVFPPIAKETDKLYGGSMHSVDDGEYF